METTTSNELILDRQSLARLAEKHRDEYANNEPFPHIVIDDFLPEQVLDRVVAEFPGTGEADWIDFDGTVQVKLAQKAEEDVSPFTRMLLYQFNSAPFLSFIERLSGIDGLLPDPHFYGGGLHQIRRGGYLKVHADFTFHPDLRIDRRINALIYLNRDWDASYGGDLELWDADMTRCVKKVAPIFNRLVVFTTTNRSFHGHPQPLECPVDRTRKSIALYYYTNGRPADESRTAETDWRLRSEDKERSAAKRAISLLVPPVVWELRKRLQRREPR